jgi:hypothetical protein
MARQIAIVTSLAGSFCTRRETTAAGRAVVQSSASCAASPGASAAATTCEPALQESPDAPARTPTPKGEFVTALRQFAEALAGNFGDERERVWSSIESMDSALIQWDEAIREYRATLPMLNYCSLAYSAWACVRIGMSGSASFHRVRKSW